MIGQSASQRSQARGLIMSWFVDCVTLHTGTLRGDIVLHCTLGYSGETYTTPSFNLGFLGETFQMKFFTPFELLKHILFSFLHCYVAVVTTQCTTVHCYGNIATPKLSTVHFYSDIATTKLHEISFDPSRLKDRSFRCFLSYWGSILQVLFMLLRIDPFGH